MAKIKQIKVYSNSTSSWKTGDIGADASNIDLASAIGTYTDVENAIGYINNNKISKTGDTFTNELTAITDIESGVDNQAYSSGVFGIQDVNNLALGCIQGYTSVGNNVIKDGIQITAINDRLSEQDKYNYLKLTSDYQSLGGFTIPNHSVEVSHPAAWRAAIGAQQTLTAGDNISISSSTISATDTTYAAGTTATAGLVPTGGTNGQVLKTNSSGARYWAADVNTTYAVGTTAAAGLVPTGGTNGQVLKRNSTGGLTWSTDLNTTYTAASLGAATTAAVNAAQSTANHAKTIADAINTTHVYANGSAKNVSTTTDTILISTTLGKGNWLVLGWARFANNTTGRRAIHISTGSNSTTRLEAGAGLTLAPCSGAYTEAMVHHFINCTGNTVVNICGYQASGSTLSCQGRIQAKKLGTL